MKILLLLTLVSCMFFQCTTDNTDKPKVKYINPPGENTKAYSTAVRVGNMLYLSGATGTDPKTGKLVGDNIEEQTKQVLENIKANLENNGSNLEQTIRCTVFLTDINNLEAVNKVYKLYFVNNRPARSAIAVTAVPGGAKIEIECIALVSE